MIKNNFFHEKQTNKQKQKQNKQKKNAKKVYINKM